MSILDFAVGDKVNKIDGYSYPGIVVSVFAKMNGQQRLVVEFDPPEGSDAGKGMLHIFSPKQLFKVKHD